MTALVSQVTYGPLEAAFLSCKQVASLSDICLGVQEKQSLSVLKKLTVNELTRTY